MSPFTNCNAHVCQGPPEAVASIDLMSCFEFKDSKQAYFEVRLVLGGLEVVQRRTVVQFIQHNDLQAQLCSATPQPLNPPGVISCDAHIQCATHLVFGVRVQQLSDDMRRNESCTPSDQYASWHILVPSSAYRSVCLRAAIYAGSMAVCKPVANHSVICSVL